MTSPCGRSCARRRLCRSFRKKSTARGSWPSRCSTRAIRNRASRSSSRCASNYWKSYNFSTLNDGLFDVVIEYVGRLPSPQCEIFFGALGGAAARPTPDSAAYPHRDAQFVMNFHGRWENPADDARCIGWARDFFNASAPFASGGVYVNFLTADEGDRVRAAYGSNYDRLAQVKRKYDPKNLFRMNQNIKAS